MVKHTHCLVCLTILWGGAWRVKKNVLINFWYSVQIQSCVESFLQSTEYPPVQNEQ